MNELIAKLYDQALVLESNGDYVAGELDPVKFAELIVGECIVDFYRQYFDDEGDDITAQVNRYVEDLFRGDARLDRIEAQLRQQAHELCNGVEP
jgi:hypothetical protein